MDSTTLSNIITITAVLSSMLAIWWNLHKFGDGIKKETEWRTGITRDMKDVLTQLSSVLQKHDTTVALVNDLLTFKIDQSHINKANDKEHDTLWKRIDSHMATIEDTRKSIEAIHHTIEDIRKKETK